MVKMIGLGVAAVVALVPAMTGLVGNPSLSQQVPVQNVRPADHRPHAVPSPSRGHEAPPRDDHGRHLEPGDDRGNHAEPGDDRGSGSGGGSGPNRGPGGGAGTHSGTSGTRVG